MITCHPELELLEDRLPPGQLLDVASLGFGLAFRAPLLAGAGPSLLASPVDPLDDIPAPAAARPEGVLRTRSEVQLSGKPTGPANDGDLARPQASRPTEPSTMAPLTTGQGFLLPDELSDTDALGSRHEQDLLDAFASPTPPERVPPPLPPPPGHLCAPQVLLDDPFDNLDNWSDLSTAVTWGEPPQQHSAFNVQDGVVSLNRDGPDSTVGYTSYTQADQLRAFTALDFQFPTPIDHAHNTITIDFRARWDELTNNSSGERGRMLFILTHNYPAGGLDLTPDAKVSAFDQAWWAQPAYHLRIRAGDSSQADALLQYGGGLSADGAFEQYDDTGGHWWLPGFISAAGGGTPGVGPDYPANSWVRTPTGIASTDWHSYRYIVRPNDQEVWYDQNNDGHFVLEAALPLPFTNVDNAPLYQYFPTLEGLRVFWNGAGGPDGTGHDAGQAYLGGLRITVTPTSCLRAVAQSI